MLVHALFHFFNRSENLKKDFQIAAGVLHAPNVGRYIVEGFDCEVRLCSCDKLRVKLRPNCVAQIILAAFLLVLF